jgi:hypothetical protein
VAVFGFVEPGPVTDQTHGPEFLIFG